MDTKDLDKEWKRVDPEGYARTKEIHPEFYEELKKQIEVSFEKAADTAVYRANLESLATHYFFNLAALCAEILGTLLLPANKPSIHEDIRKVAADWEVGFKEQVIKWMKLKGFDLGDLDGENNAT